MRFLERVKSFMGLDFVQQGKNEVQSEEERAARQVASRFARGSVGIQAGAFLTGRDLDQQMAKFGLKEADKVS